MLEPKSGLWFIFDYAGVKRALDDTETFGSDMGSIGAHATPPWLVFFDPPRHTKLRNIISQAFTPRVVSLMDRADREGLTVRACANLVAKSRSHGTFVGTVEGLVDHMQHWQASGGCDGFNIMPAWFPDELDVFVDQVIPVLQRRGLFRTEYEGTRLRNHLGLPYPER